VSLGRVRNAMGSSHVGNVYDFQNIPESDKQNIIAQLNGSDEYLFTNKINKKIFMENFTKFGRRFLDVIRILERSKDPHLFDSIKFIASIKSKSNDDEISQILSTGRCGTMAISMFFNEMESVRPYHHLSMAINGALITEFFYRYIAFDFGDQEFGNVERIGKFIDIFIRSRGVECFQIKYREKPIIINHWDTFFAPILYCLFPGAKFLYIKREEVDVALSNLTKYGTTNKMSSLSINEYSNTENYNDWNSVNPLIIKKNGKYKAPDIYFNVIDEIESLCWTIRAHNKFAENFISMIPKSQKLFIRSEDLFEQNEVVQKELLDFFKLPEKRGLEAMRDVYSEKRNEKFLKGGLNDVDKKLEKVRRLLDTKNSDSLINLPSWLPL
jgi:hypothetical protein